MDIYNINDQRHILLKEKKLLNLTDIKTHLKSIHFYDYNAQINFCNLISRLHNWCSIKFKNILIIRFLYTELYDSKSSLDRI